MTPYYEHAGITIYHGDCREILPTVTAEVLVTDPPYGTGGWRRTAAGAGSNPAASRSGTLLCRNAVSLWAEL